jgi:hypothetical protein
MPESLDRPGQPRATDQPDVPDMPERLRSAPPRPDPPPELDLPDETGPADRLAADDQPARWSRPDLRQRLERLPPGHPSSLRNDDQSPDLTDPDSQATGEQTEQAHRDYPDESDREPDAVRGHYWQEVPRFLREWADHVRRRPAEHASATVDRSQDPAGSWRGEGGQYLNSELHGQANEEIGKVRGTEESLTRHMTETERDNVCGGWLEGLEHRLKGGDRFREKIADLLATDAPDAPVEQIAAAIPDAIRYTFCAKPENYTTVYWDIKDRLQEHGFSMCYSENHWFGAQYKGINTRWITSEGQLFEVQFHTPESFHSKEQVTHRTYERLRSALTGDEERRELMAFQQEVCSWIPVPEGAADIPNYREEDN